MPTVLLLDTSHDLRSESIVGNLTNSNETPLQILKQAVIEVIDGIHNVHNFEYMSFVTFSREQTNLNVVKEFTNTEHQQIKQEIEKIPTNIEQSSTNADLAIDYASNLSAAIKQTYTYIANALGKNAATQIILFTDNSNPDFDESIFNVHPECPVKIHIFCISNWTSRQIQRYHQRANARLKTNLRIKEHAHKQQRLFDNYRKLAQIYEGSFYYLDYNNEAVLRETGVAADPKTVHDSCSQIMKKCVRSFLAAHYSKFSGYLALGHLVSAVSLSPDPNLTLWNVDKKDNPLPLPNVLSIMGFLPVENVAVPLCISKHTIIHAPSIKSNLEAEIDPELVGEDIIDNADGASATTDSSESPSKRSRKQQDTGSFFDLLHQTLQEMKMCAVVQLKDHPKRPDSVIHHPASSREQYGLVCSAFQKDNSGMILFVLHSNVRFPWLQYDFNSLMSSVLLKRETQVSMRPAGDEHESSDEEDNKNAATQPAVVVCVAPPPPPQDLFLVHRHPVSHYQNNSQLLFTKEETLQIEFNKIDQNLRKVPIKVSVIYSACEKLRKIASVYMYDEIITTTLVSLLERERNDTSGDPKKPAVIADLIAQLQSKDYNVPLEVPTQLQAPTSAQQQQQQQQQGDSQSAPKRPRTSINSLLN